MFLVQMGCRCEGDEELSKFSHSVLSRYSKGPTKESPVTLQTTLGKHDSKSSKHSEYEPLVFGPLLAIARMPGGSLSLVLRSSETTGR